MHQFIWSNYTNGNVNHIWERFVTEMHNNSLWKTESILVGNHVRLFSVQPVEAQGFMVFFSFASSFYLRKNRRKFRTLAACRLAEGECYVDLWYICTVLCRCQYVQNCCCFYRCCYFDFHTFCVLGLPSSWTHHMSMSDRSIGRCKQAGTHIRNVHMSKFVFFWNHTPMLYGLPYIRWTMATCIIGKYFQHGASWSKYPDFSH